MIMPMSYNNRSELKAIGEFYTKSRSIHFAVIIKRDLVSEY